MRDDSSPAPTKGNLHQSHREASTASGPVAAEQGKTEWNLAGRRSRDRLQARLYASRMPCPRCEASSPRTLVAPGHWRCQNVFVDSAHVAFVPPFAPGNPTPVGHAVPVGPNYYSCDVTYPVAPDELTQDERAQEAAFIQQTRQREARVAEWQQQVPEMLAAIEDPIGRLMAVVKAWGRPGVALSGLYRQGSIRDLERSPPWDHDAVQRWFLSSVITEPTEQPVVDHTRTLLGGTKRRERRALGWVFHRGSTAVDWFSDDRAAGPSSPGSYVVQTITVLRDGRRRSGGGAPTRPGEGFNFKAVEEMTAMCRVPTLPSAPPLTRRQDEHDRQAGQQAPATYSALKDIMDARGLRVHKF